MRSVITFVVIAVGLFVALPTPAIADDAKARAIMEKVDARDDGNNVSSDMEMILIDKRGSQRKRILRSSSKDFGEDSYRLLFFLSPADVKNTGFLTYDYDATDRDDDQWLYLPALGKTKRIASSDKSGSFMGSDFTYSDMTSRDLEDYDFRLLKESEVGDHKVWLIESKPRTKKVIEETGYTKSVLFVRQDNYVAIRGVHFLERGGKRKYFEIKKLELIDGIWTSLETTMKTTAGKTTLHRTILRFANVKYNQSFDDSIFTVRTLEKGL